LSRRQPLVVGLVLAALALILVVALLLPKLSSVNHTRSELDQAEQAGQQLQAQVAALREAKQEAPKIRQQLAQVQTAIPPTTDLPSLIRLLRSAADSAAVDFLSVSPGAPTASLDGQTSVMATQITVTGSYFSIEEFLYRLERLPRAAKVSDFTVGSGPGGPPELQITLTAQVFTTDLSAGPGSQPGPTEGGA
jgi:Tfp pilus assembly protein PilO